MGERPPVQDDRPLVSVITPTVGDSTNLRTRCIPSVISQTYSNIEHIIVCDGPSDIEETNTPIQRVVHLGRNWHSFTRPHPSWGTMARLVGSGLARGQYIAYNDHDDELDPQHVEKLVDLLESTDSDWVFSQMAIVRRGQFQGQVIGDGKPRWRNISTQMLLHKVEMFNIANWDPYCRDNLGTLPRKERHLATYGSDWDLVHRWLKSSAKWAFLSEVTVIHHRDRD